MNLPVRTRNSSVRFAAPVAALAALLALLPAAPAAAVNSGFDLASERAAWRAENPEACALLDDAETVQVMDGLLLKLAVLCERADLLGRVLQEENEGPGEALGVDVRANDPGTDSGPSRTQSETSVAFNETTGTLCAGYNDSFHGVTQGLGYTGFSRSTDGGATWSDRGALSSSSFGDPALVWRRVDEKFYIAALSSAGLGIWRSDNDCQSFTFVATVATGSDDKELMAVDNNPASSFYGRLYIAWTDFGSGARIFETHSSNAGASWSTQLDISTHSNVQGAWPVVAPNGDVWVAWAHWTSFQTGPLDIEVVRSTNGGSSFSFVANPASGQVLPRDSSASSSCGRPSLKGNLRYLPSPQIAVGPDGAVHVVYGYDPDGFNTGDVINVYYRRSTDNGASWGPEVQLNTVGTNDQFFPTLSVGPNNVVSAAWYDRRDDGNNLRVRYYQRLSFDGGVTFEPDAPIADSDAPVVLDPNLATCYHGDYDTQIQTDAEAILVWADDRGTEGGGNNPDVWTDTTSIAVDFLVQTSPSNQTVCVGDDAMIDVDVPSFNGFTDPVTLSVGGEPAGTTTGFSVNPVTPPGSSVLTVGNTGGVAAGTYGLTVTGTAGASSHDGNASLTFVDPISAPALSSPQDGATNISVTPTLVWTAVAGANDYFVEVDDDPGFGSPEFTDTTTNTFTIASGLTGNTTYSWRVTASDDCGLGTPSGAFTFTTRDTMPFLDGFESGDTSQWSSTVP